MNNNKKILKRSSAAFLAALNIFNFAGGSSKALDCNDFVITYMSMCPNGDHQRIFELLKFLDSLKDINFTDVGILESVEDISEGVKLYKLKTKKVLFLFFCDDVSFQQSTILDSLKIKKQELDIDSNFIIYKIDSGATSQQSTINKMLKKSNDFDFVDANKISNLRFWCETFKKFNDELEKLKKEKDDAIKLKDEELKQAKEANDTNTGYFCKSLVLIDLVKFLQDDCGDAGSLEKVQGSFEFQNKFSGNAPFKLVGNNDNDKDFLGNVEFQYDYNNKKGKFSINELLGELDKKLGSGDGKTFENLKPIDLNSIKMSQAKQATGENGDNKEEKEEVLDVNKYKEKLQEYTKTLNKTIEIIVPGYKEFKDYKTKCENNVEKILGKLDKTPGSSDTLEKQFSDIEQGIGNLQTEKETAENNSKKADSKAKKRGVVAVLGWIGILVNLGYVFQNELKNACGTVYKKVLELKNSILG